MQGSSSNAQQLDHSGENDLSGHTAASVKPIQQDFQAAADRMKSLRQFHQSCCFFWLYYPMRVFKLGYDIEDFLRYRSFEKTNKGLDLRRDTHGLCVNLHIQELVTLKEHIIGLIKPVVRVHTVYLDSGMYIKSPDKPPCKPTYTTPHLSIHSGSKCIWNEDLTIEASYADAVSENTLILIEILDTKASVYIEKEQQDKRMYMKRVAWGFLLPIGTILSGDNCLFGGIFTRLRVCVMYLQLHKHIHIFILIHIHLHI
ncbi:hypothetical protein EON63_23755 [archaeon]|nr:MAG: hypothetical protein EON63_23755 [archaeon]